MLANIVPFFANTVGAVATDCPFSFTHGETPPMTKYLLEAPHMTKTLPSNDTPWFAVVCDQQFLNMKIGVYDDDYKDRFGASGVDAQMNDVLTILSPSHNYSDKRGLLRQLVKRMADKRNFRQDEYDRFRKSIEVIVAQSPFLEVGRNSTNNLALRKATWGELVDALPNVTLINMLLSEINFNGHPMDLTSLVFRESLKGFEPALLGNAPDVVPDTENKTGVVVGLSARHHVLTYDDAFEKLQRTYKSPIPTTQKDTVPSGNTGFVGVKVKPEMRSALDMLFKEATGKTEGVESFIGSHVTNIDNLNQEIYDAEIVITRHEEEIERLRQALSAPSIATTPDVDPDADALNYTTKPAWELFLPEEQKELRRANADHKFPGGGIFDVRVPFIEWGEKHHPDVPFVDENFLFHPDTLGPALYGLAFNKPTMVYGHTGTGKSSFINQIGARCNFPTYRINLDSEITRLDMIGRDTLIEKDGITVSKFVDGILPSVMNTPCIIQCDEVDFARPDVLYAMQPVLEEGGSLRITEDGGRVVPRHKWCHIFATANTRGQGDEHGMYQGARVQSQAFLDRFQMWIDMPYLQYSEEVTLLKSRVPAITQGMADTLVRIAHAVREAFMDGRILTTISPRGLVTAAHYMSVTSETSEQAKIALQHSVVNKASDVDVAQINEFVESFIK